MKSNRGDFWPDDDLEILGQQLDRWRGKQAGRARLPEGMWESAATLARRLGASRVSRHLGLSYPALQRRTAAAADAGGREQPKFVELTLAGSKPETQLSGRYRAELLDGSGRRLMLDLGQDRSAGLALAESFWSLEG